jgi:hypothetical protein
MTERRLYRVLAQSAHVALGGSAILLVTLAAAAPSGASHARAAGCSPSRVHYSRYPGGAGDLAGLPWVAGSPSATGLVGLLWYWPDSWRQQGLQSAQIPIGGTTAQGFSTKILWAFLGRSARNGGGARMVVTGSRLDALGTFRQSFSPIWYHGQQGAPSFASIIDVPAAGCWQLNLVSGKLRGSVVFRAVNP